MELDYPLVPLRKAVLFPGVTCNLRLTRPMSVVAIEKAHKGVVVVAQRTAEVVSPVESDFYSVGVLCQINEPMQVAAANFDDPRGGRIRVTGLRAFSIDEFALASDHWRAQGREATSLDEWLPEFPSLCLQLKERMATYFSKSQIPNHHRLTASLQAVMRPDFLLNQCLYHLPLSVELKQKLLEETLSAPKMRQVLDLIGEQINLLELRSELRSKVNGKFIQSQRENLLREQLRTIREELGEEGDRHIEKLRSKLEALDLAPEIQDVWRTEIARLSVLPSTSAEYHVLVHYLEWLAAVPWKADPLPEINIEGARQILDQRHYGLSKVKRRILQSLAVAKLRGDSQGSILCLVGPPGVGKTSLGQSVADALSRKFIRTSLGGIHEEAEIRGHRRTYVGALPGRIIQSLRKVGSTNPVMLLDEIDKVGYGRSGELSAALLEVLDPEQHSTFLDRYLDVPVDLSKVFFIATANIADDISGPLRDRLEMIDVSGYTLAEKEHIGAHYLAPKKMRECGLSMEQVQMQSGVIERMVSHYTREAGVRRLGRCLAELGRYCAEEVAEGKPTPIPISLETVGEVLGPEIYLPEMAAREAKPGVATGLAWTSVGGEIMFIEATAMPGQGNLVLTGQLGSVMKESAQIGLSFIKSQSWHFPEEFVFREHDLHIHFPAGGIPKDGPSAGLAILTAMASLLFMQPVEPKLAMTGELTLRGAVLPVGGIKEKVLAAHRAGIERVVLPALNRPDLREIPNDVCKDLQFHFVESVSELLALALHVDFDAVQDHWAPIERVSHPALAQSPEG